MSVNGWVIDEVGIYSRGSSALKVGNGADCPVPITFVKKLWRRPRHAEVVAPMKKKKN
jgi:hypothetical protein